MSHDYSSLGFLSWVWDVQNLPLSSFLARNKMMSVSWCLWFYHFLAYHLCLLTGTSQWGCFFVCFLLGFYTFLIYFVISPRSIKKIALTIANKVLVIVKMPLYSIHNTKDTSSHVYARVIVWKFYFYCQENTVATSESQR